MTNKSENWEGIVDTCILVHVLNGKPEAKAFLKSKRRSSLVLSTVTALEFRNINPDKNEIKEREKLLDVFDQIPPNTHDWRRALRLYKELFKARKAKPKWSDLLIAETAKGLKLKVFTADKKDFKLIPNLDVEYPY